MFRFIFAAVLAGMALVYGATNIFVLARTNPIREMLGEMELSEAHREAIEVTAMIDTLEQVYFSRFGEYGEAGELERVVPHAKEEEWRELQTTASLHTSPAKSAYMVVVHEPGEDVECAAHRDRSDAPRFADVPSDESAVDLAGWRLLPDGTVRCRKGGWAPRFLHPLGWEYVGEPER